MRFTITHTGVPVGTVELEPQPAVVAGPVEPLGAYAALRPLVSAASAALQHLGFPAAAGEPGTPIPPPSVALGRAAALGRELELRDRDGALIPTEFVELVEVADVPTRLVALVGFRAATASQASRLPSRAGRRAGSEPPAP